MLPAIRNRRHSSGASAMPEPTLFEVFTDYV